MKIKQTKHKIGKLWSKSNKQKAEIDRLNKIDIYLLEDNWAKQIYNKPILENKLIIPDYIDKDANSNLKYWKYIFEIDVKCPEEILPYFRFMPIFHTEDGILDKYEITGLSKWYSNYYFFDYHFYQIEKNTYKFRGILHMKFSYNDENDEFFPLYLNLILYIVNPYKYYEIQTNKT